MRQQEQRDRKLRAKKPAHGAPSSRVSTNCRISQTGWWCTQSHSNLSPVSKFPANRQNNREFCRIRPFGTNLRSRMRGNPMASAKFPIQLNRDFFLKEQGIYTLEQ